MAQQNSINSQINLGLSLDLATNFKTPEVRQLAETFVLTFNNLLRGIEQYGGFTQKDPSYWAYETPVTTLLRQNLGRFYAIASENIAASAIINIHNVAGIANIRNANSSTNKPAVGYCSTSGGVLLGDEGEFILSQGIIPLTGVVPGDRLFLSATNGLLQIGPDLTVGHIEQFCGIGVAVDIAYIDITMGSWIQH